MIKELEQALAAARDLPEEDQLAVVDFIETKVIERKIAEARESFAKFGGRPAEELLDELARKYGR
ncbi:MAG TPA: hypothetical protein VJL84_01510 [Kiloniellales bacterium]|nr:hypothetical protein [Kiloniellales bacterium]